VYIQKPKEQPPECVTVVEHCLTAFLPESALDQAV